MVVPLLLARHRLGYERQGCFCAIDVVLHRGRPAQPDRPDNFSVHLNGKPSTPRRHTRKRGDAGQKRRVALDKVEKLLRGDAEQSCVCLVLGHLSGRDRGPIHPAKGLEIAAVVENRYVLANTNFSGFRHRCIHHFLCQLIRDAVFLHYVSHWIPSSTRLVLPVDRSHLRSGIHPAINSKIRAGNVRGLRTGDERHRASDLVNTPKAAECRTALLRHRPIAPTASYSHSHPPPLTLPNPDPPPP